MIKKIFGLLIILLSLSDNCMAEPRVVVSINPIHGLVVALMENVGTPSLLLSPKESPHHFNLLPSQASQMSKADLFVWIGPDLEKVLEKPVLSLVKSEKILTLMEVPDLILLEQANGKTDPHIWLDPVNAKIMASAIAERLMEIDPDNKEVYALNLEKLLKSLDELKETIISELSDSKGQSYLVYHDAYKYFESAFQLEPSIPLVTDEGGSVQAAQRLQIEKLVKEKQIRYIFSEPQHGHRTALSLSKQLNLKLGELDPLGMNDLENAENSYVVMMLNIAAVLKDSLNEGKNDGEN